MFIQQLIKLYLPNEYIDPVDRIEKHSEFLKYDKSHTWIKAILGWFDMQMMAIIMS